jgi:hypothetical protein
LSIFKRRKYDPPGDPEGVEKARRARQEAEDTLQRDREEVIKPLQHELYKNNIQEMVEELLRSGRHEKRHNGGSPALPGDC